MARTSGVGAVLGVLVMMSALPGCDERTWTEVDTPVQDTAGVPVTGPGGRPGAGGTTLFAGKTTRSSDKLAPIAGGTLLVTRDGHAIAADPDRDLVYVVNLADQSFASVALQAGDEPGRVVEGPPGTAYVAARRGGVVVAVDTALGTARRIPACAAPRGLAYDAALSKLYVACRSGVLAEVDTQTETVSARHHLDPDLRDVVISGQELVVSRFKSAEVLVVSRAGDVLRRTQPQPARGSSVTPSVAYRTLALPGGGVLVGHVESSNVELPSGAGAYYGASCGGSVADLSVSALNTQVSLDRMPTLASNVVGGASGPLDLAFSPDDARLAVLASGNSWSSNGVAQPNLFLTATAQVVQPGGVTVPCGGIGTSSSNVSTKAARGEPVAVAFDSSNAWVVQSREPAQLELENGTIITLATDRRFDTGFAMFHMNTGGGVSCTSCHPEAGEDGHTWNFSVGLRRSQALEGGASTRAPFHWEGDLANFEALFDEVMMKRMSLPANVTGEQRSALRDWLDSVPHANTADDLDADAVERGRALFEDKEIACASCHGGPDYTDNLPHDVGTGAAFITPSLVGVNLRAPLFHDGCAVSLAGRFGPCGGGDAHGITSKLTPANQADLVAFMQSL